MKDCLKLIKGSKALEEHFKGIDNLPIEQQREVALNRAKDYYAQLHQELEGFKKVVNPKYKKQKFVAEDNTSKIEEVKSKYQSKINEAQKKGDTKPNADIQPGVEPSVQQGQGENTQPTVDGKSNKETTKRVKARAFGNKEAEYDVEFNEKGNVTKITNPKNGKEVPKFVERKLKPTKKNLREHPTLKKLQVNGKFTEIKSVALGVETNNKIDTETKAKQSKLIDAFVPSNEHEHALNYFINGGRVKLKDAKSLGHDTNSGKWASGFNEDSELNSIEAAAEKIVESSEQNLDFSEVFKALQDIVQLNTSIDGVRNQILEIQDAINNNKKEEELYYYKNSLSEKELAIFESSLAEEDYLNELSYEEKIEYYEEQFQRPQEIDGERNGGTTSVQERSGAKEKVKSPEAEEVDKQITQAEEAVKKAKTTLQNKAKNLDKTINEDQENLFGERESQQEQQLFDERVDLSERNKATEKERQAVKDAEQNLKDLKAKKKQLQETGEVTSEIDFDNKKGLVAKDIKSLYKIHRDIFGLNRVKAFASAVVTDRMIGTMAKRQGIPKKEMYSYIEFRKGDEITLEELKNNNKSIFQGVSEIEESDNLLVLHNLNEDNIKNVYKIGGLVMPSLAITKKDIPFEGYGSISLIAGKDMVDPKKGGRTFASDIYSPRYPGIRYTANQKQLAEKFGKYEDMLPENSSRGTVNSLFSEMEDEGIKAAYNSTLVQTAYLQETQGQLPKIKNIAKPKVDRKLLNHYKKQKAELGWYDSLNGQADDKFQELWLEAQKKYYISKVGPKEGADIFERLYGEGIKPHMYSGIISELSRAADPKIKQDEIAFKRAVNDKTKGNALRKKKFESWVDTQFKDIDVKEEIFVKFTDNGRKYINHTAENVMRILKKADLRGGESYNYGAGSLRSAVVPQFKSVQEIKDAENKIITDEEFTKIKDEINSELIELADKIAKTNPHPNPNSFMETDRIVSIIEEAAKSGRYDFSEYGYKMTPSQYQEVKDFMDKLRNMPTSYFESKPKRVVDLSEFRAALVPRNIDAKTKRILKEKGLKLIPYNQKTEEGRKEALDKYLDKNTDVLFQKASKKNESSYWKSTVKEGLSKINQTKATPEQWVKMITDKGGKGTAQELEWIGLEDYLNSIYIGKNKVDLNDQKAVADKYIGSIPKEVVEQYIEDNQIEIQEVTKGGKRIKTYTPENYEKFPQEVTDIFEEFEDDEYQIALGLERLNYNVVREMDGTIIRFSKTQSKQDSIRILEQAGYYIDTDRNGDTYIELNEEVVDYNDLPDNLKDHFDVVVSENLDQNELIATKYSNYQLEGGENYREVLLTLPKKEPQVDKREILKELKQLLREEDNLGFETVSEALSAIRTDADFAKNWDVESPRLIELGNQYKDIVKDNKEYKSSHWDESNILAHVRMNERTLPNGERVLFIEEVQSDWAQDGKKRGFDGYNSALPEGFSVNKKDGKWIILNNEGKRVPIGARNTEQEAITAYNKANNSKGVPNMPYKKTDQWVGMAMRRVMQMASNEGFDRVAWVTGEQSADRYDLSKHYKSIEVTRYANNKYGISAVDLNGYEGINKGGLTKEEVADNIGKDLADKAFLVTDKKSKIKKPISFKTEDLSVGGEGMKTFYNSILPKVAKKEAQRFDKSAKVEVVDFKNKYQQINEEYNSLIKEENDFSESLGVNKPTKEQREFFEQFNKRFEKFKNSLPKGVAIDDFDNIQFSKEARMLLEVETSKQLSIPITQKARLNLSNAVPLFQDAQGAMLAEDGKFVIYALTNPNVSTPVHEMAHVYEHYLEDAERKDILNWAGHKQWSTETSEKFARGFEKYLASGKAPTSKLQKIFDKFKEWLTDIYNGIKGSDIDIELSPKMEAIYTKMLGADVIKNKSESKEVQLYNEAQKIIQNESIPDHKLKKGDEIYVVDQYNDDPLSSAVKATVTKEKTKTGLPPTLDGKFPPQFTRNHNLTKETYNKLVELQQKNKDLIPVIRESFINANYDIYRPLSKDFEANKKVENKSNTPIDDDTKAQGISFSKESKRDASLSKEGVVKQKNARQRKFKRFWNNTFSSNRGLDTSIVKEVESLIGDISAISTAIKFEASQFGKISKDIKKRFKKDFNDKMKLINEYLSGTDVDVSFLKDEHINQLDAFRSRIDTLSDKIINILEDKKDNLPEGSNNIERIESLIETIEGNKGKYMFRSYQAFSDKNYIDALTSKHPNAAAKKRLRDAIDFVVEDQDVTEAEAETQILTYLDNLKGFGDLVSASTEGKAKAPFLKKRKDIPEPIRALLGESKDPVKNYVASVFGMSKYISSIEYQSRLNTALFDAGLAKTEMKPGYTKLLRSKEGWDLLQDVYVPVEIAEAIDDLQPLDSLKDPAYRAMVMLSAATKLGKTVLSPTTTARNIWSGIFLSFNAGFNPFADPKLFLKGIQHSWGGKKTQTQMKAENQRLIKLGIINDGAVSREIMGIINDFSAPIDKLLSTSKMGKVMNTMQKLYALGDDSYKVVGFYTWESRYKKAGFSNSEAENMARDRIRNGFPTYSKIPRNIQKLRRIPVIGTFPSFTYEVWRTTYNNIKFIGQDLKAGVKDNNKQRFLMAANQSMGMLISGAMAYAISEFSKSILGIDDDEDDTTRNMAAPWQKDSKNVYIGKESGTYDVIDATAFFPAETILKPIRILYEKREGRDMDDKILLSLKEATGPFIGTDIFAKTVEELHQNRDNYGRKIYDGETILEGISNNPDKMTHYFMRQAGPGIYNNITEFARANEIAPDFFGEKETSYKEYTNTEALLGLVGFRLSRINYVSGIKNLAFEAKDKLRDNKTGITKKLKTSRKLNEDEIKKQVDDYVKFNKKHNKQVIIAVRGAKKQGIPRKEIETALSLVNFSKSDINEIINGNTPPLKPIGKKTVSNTKDGYNIGRFKNDPKKLFELKKNLDDNTGYFNFLLEEENYKIKKATNK